MRTAHELRERADELRAKADSFTTIDNKAGLLEIAEQYERDALAAERRERRDTLASQTFLRRTDMRSV